jgi:ribosomal protein S18 acetylase RimI-like enzyme
MMANLITFRTATADDAGALAAFGERLFRETFGPHHCAADMDAYCHVAFAVERVWRELGEHERRTIVALHHGDIIGYVQLHDGATPACVSGPGALEVLRFYVDRGWHGRGIAQALMARIVTMAEERDAQTLFLKVWEHNARAIAFYEKLGFRRVGSAPFPLGGDRPIDYIMMRELGRAAYPCASG